MLEKAKTKLGLIFVLTGTICIISIGIITWLTLENMITNLSGKIESVDFIKNDVLKIETSLVIVAIVYIILSIILSIIVVKKIISPAEDIIQETEKKIKEVSMQKKQVETMLLHMTDGILAFDMEGKISLTNPAATRLLRILPEDDNFDKIFGKYNVDINLEKVIYLENWTSTAERIEVGDKYIYVFFAPLRNETEKPTGVIVVIQDITEHVKLDNMRKEFVADVSHELKTPITSIMGYADTLLEGDYDKETQEKFLNVIATEARRMAKLVTDLLTLSRFDNNEIRIQKTEFDLGELVKKCQEKLQIEIQKKNHKAECFVTANVPMVYADRDGIERVVLNIISNSIKYTQENGVIKMYVGYIYNDAYIKIIDNGLGIPEEDLDRIYDRFYRVDKSRTREMGGTGLGLSIAKEILDQNGRKYRHKK